METNNERAASHPVLRAVGGNAEPEPDVVQADARPVAAATVTPMEMADERAITPTQVRSALSPANAVAVQPNGDRMETVVDLLFGSHLNEINANIRSLEKQFGARVNKAESEMRVRIESLDRHTKDEIGSLIKADEKERASREGQIGKLSDRFDAAIRQLEMRLDRMESESARTRQLAQKALDERLTKATDATNSLRKTMEQEIASMKVSLSTRAELAGMFTELGKRLEANSSGSGLG